jgi:hypothetical protein
MTQPSDADYGYLHNAPAGDWPADQWIDVGVAPPPTAASGRSDGLIEFIRARLDEVERVARAARQDADVWQAAPSPYGHIRAVSEDDAWTVGDVATPQQAKHIAHHDPARVLRDVEAQRRIVRELWVGLEDYAVNIETIRGDDFGMRDFREGLLRLLALPDDDHPDYRDEWRP